MGYRGNFDGIDHVGMASPPEACRIAGGDSMSSRFSPAPAARSARGRAASRSMRNKAWPQPARRMRARFEPGSQGWPEAWAVMTFGRAVAPPDSRRTTGPLSRLLRAGVHGIPGLVPINDNLRHRLPGHILGIDVHGEPQQQDRHRPCQEEVHQPGEQEIGRASVGGSGRQGVAFPEAAKFLWQIDSN